MQQDVAHALVLHVLVLVLHQLQQKQSQIVNSRIEIKGDILSPFLLGSVSL